MKTTNVPAVPTVPAVAGRRPELALLVAAAIALAACGSAARPDGSTAPGDSPGASSGPASSPAGTIEHQTGARDVVFRFAEGGGFVPMGFFATEAPQFTLYGDGTVIFRDNSIATPPQSNPNLIVLAPFRTARLDEADVQAFLRFALADSGLGIARASYTPGNVADAPTATFTVNAGGLSKTVAVEALGFDNPQSPDAPILAAMAKLGDVVRDFGSSVEDETTWVPDRWRGVLTPDALNPPTAWPWPDIAPAEFVQRPEPDAPQFPVRTMTPAEIDALGLDGIEGGFSGLSLTGPDGKVYFFALRPLLPDERY